MSTYPKQESNIRQKDGLHQRPTWKTKNCIEVTYGNMGRDDPKAAASQKAHPNIMTSHEGTMPAAP